MAYNIPPLPPVGRGGGRAAPLAPEPDDMPLLPAHLRMQPAPSPIFSDADLAQRMNKEELVNIFASLGFGTRTDLRRQTIGELRAIVPDILANVPMDVKQRLSDSIMLRSGMRRARAAPPAISENELNMMRQDVEQAVNDGMRNTTSMTLVYSDGELIVPVAPVIALNGGNRIVVRVLQPVQLGDRNILSQNQIVNLDLQKDGTWRNSSRGITLIMTFDNAVLSA